MKKTLQMIGLFFSILFVLAGCSGVTGETFSELDTRVTQTPLFDESDVSIITTNIELSEGDWIFKETYEGTTHTPIETTYKIGNDTLQYSFLSYKSVYVYELTIVKDFIITTSSNSRFEEKMDSQNKTKYDNFAKAHGVSLTWNGTTRISEYSFTNKSVDDFSITNAIDIAKNSYVITKRNIAGTRYIIKDKYGNHIYYFAKK